MEANKPRLLIEVARPLIRFIPSKTLALDSAWKANNHYVRMLLSASFRLAGRSSISIGRPKLIGSDFMITDAAIFVRRWDHLISVERIAVDKTRYTDRVEIDAGSVTLLMSLFARFFFWHRQTGCCAWRDVGLSTMPVTRHSDDPKLNQTLPREEGQDRADAALGQE
jgi:hypothetical protein